MAEEEEEEEARFFSPLGQWLVFHVNTESRFGGQCASVSRQQQPHVGLADIWPRAYAPTLSRSTSPGAREAPIFARAWCLFWSSLGGGRILFSFSIPLFASLFSGLFCGRRLVGCARRES